MGKDLEEGVCNEVVGGIVEMEEERCGEDVKRNRIERLEEIGRGVGGI